MTRDEALRLSYWAWLELSISGLGKGSVKSVDLSVFTNYCPLCEVFEANSCKGCPVIWSEEVYKDHNCIAHDSPYDEWEFFLMFDDELSTTDLEKRKKLAKAVLGLIEETMQRLGVEL